MSSTHCPRRASFLFNRPALLCTHSGRLSFLILLLISSLRLFAQPVNDLFENRTAITGDFIQLELAVTNATFNPNEPKYYPNSEYPVIWFKWTAPDDGIALLQSSQFAMIFEGSELTNLVQFPLNSFAARAGREYQIAFAFSSPEATLNFHISLERFLPYSGLEPGETYPHFPARTLQWLDFPNSSSITNLVVFLDSSLLIRTNNLANIPLPILSEGGHRLNASAQSASGYNYILKQLDFIISHPNSSFTNRIRLTGDVVMFEADSRGVQGYLWWSWTAPASGQVTFEDLNRSGFSMSLFSGSSSDQLTWVEGQRVEQGATYVIRGERSGLPTVAPFRLRLFPIHPANDNFSNSRLISGNEFSDWICISTATGEPTEPPSPNGPWIKTLWFTFVPSASGLATIFSGAGEPNWAVSIFTGSSLASLQEISSSTYYFCQSHVQAGQTYHFRIQSNAASPSASEIRFRFDSPPSNDQFSSATALSGNQTNFTAHLNSTTAEINEPLFSTNRHSAWWRWTPQSSGVATLSIPGIRNTNDLSVPPAEIIPWPIREIFRGNTLSELEPSPSFPLHDEVIGFPVEAGVTYSIRLSYLKPFFVPEPYEVLLNVGDLEITSPAFNSVHLLPDFPTFQWTSSILTNPTARVELIEQPSFFILDSGIWMNTIKQGTSVWPNFALTSTNFSLGRKTVFARATTAGGPAIYSLPFRFVLLKSLPLRLQLFPAENQPQNLLVRELSGQAVIIESSTDLKTWTLETWTSPNASNPDSAALLWPSPNDTHRFYRSTPK